MSEIITIIKREYLTRVGSRAFIFASFVLPLAFSLIFGSLNWADINGVDESKIALSDPSGWVKSAVEESGVPIEYIDNFSVEQIKVLVNEQAWDGVFYVPAIDSVGAARIQYYYTGQPNWAYFNQIESAAEKYLLNSRLRAYGVEDVNIILGVAKADTRVELVKVDLKEGEWIDYRLQTILCSMMGLAIFMSIFFSAGQVVQGVQEEKVNRIVEIIVTSVSPVKFMMGKIFGIALLGMTQVVIWIVVGGGLYIVLHGGFEAIDFEQLNQAIGTVSQVGIGTLMAAFFVFFVAGYLLYSSMFAVIGAIANHNEEMQQIMTIVVLPLILSIFLLHGVINNPDGSLACWASMIPFTSPVIMVARIVLGVPLYQVLLSLFILAATLLVVMWLSGRVYRMGILNTGKKASVKDIIAWIKSK